MACQCRLTAQSQRNVLNRRESGRHAQCCGVARGLRNEANGGGGGTLGAGTRVLRRVGGGGSGADMNE